MAFFVIAEPCVDCKDTACVDECPVDAIHPRQDEPDFESSKMLYINPDECTSCGACQSACPTEAIFRDDDIPQKWEHYIAINADHYK